MFSIFMPASVGYDLKTLQGTHTASAHQVEGSNQEGKEGGTTVSGRGKQRHLPSPTVLIE